LQIDSLPFFDAVQALIKPYLRGGIFAATAVKSNQVSQIAHLRQNYSDLFTNRKTPLCVKVALFINRGNDMRMIYQWAACIACLTTLSGPSWAGTFEEGFEDILALDDGGWIFDNRSDFVGDASWGQGFPGLFPAQAGPDNSYILGAVGQTGGNVLCDWLILPDVGFVEQLNFFTRTESNAFSSDRLVVVHSPSGGINTGPCVVDDVTRGTEDFGDFTVIGAVNPNLQAGGYPEQWTEINVPVNADGRLALVYFVEDVGQPPFNGQLIAIDSLNVGPAGPPGPVGTPTAVPSLTAVGMGFMAGLMLLMMYMNRHRLLKNQSKH